MPFFLPLAASGGEPVFAGGNPCLSASRGWVRNITDVGDRTLAVVQPDGSSNVSLYSANSGGGSRIEFIDALGNHRFEERNPLGELAASTDAGGLRVDYDYDATGNLLAARRDADAGVDAQKAAIRQRLLATAGQRTLQQLVVRRTAH